MKITFSRGERERESIKKNFFPLFENVTSHRISIWRISCIFVGIKKKSVLLCALINDYYSLWEKNHFSLFMNLLLFQDFFLLLPTVQNDIDRTVIFLLPIFILELSDIAQILPTLKIIFSIHSLTILLLHHKEKNIVPFTFHHTTHRMTLKNWKK